MGFSLLRKRINALLAVQSKNLSPLFRPFDEQVVWHMQSDVALFLSGEYLSRQNQICPEAMFP